MDGGPGADERRRVATLTPGRGRHARDGGTGPGPSSPGNGRHALDPADDAPTVLIPRQDSGRHQLIRPVPGPARHRRAVPPTAVAAALGALTGACVVAVVGRAMVDDAYITLAYARTLGLYGQWGVYPGVPANTATSPLNVLLLGGLTAVVRDAITASGILLTFCYAACGALLSRIGARVRPGRGSWAPWCAPPAGLALLATSPLLLSTAGLESVLAVTLLLGLAERVLARGPATAGVLAGLLVLTRPDLGVVALVGVAACGRGWWRAGLAATATALPWLVWAWAALGSAIPDTLLVKAGVHWGPWSYANGAGLWWEKFPASTALVAVPIVAGLAALPYWLTRRELRPVGTVLGLGAVAHAGTMAALDVAPFHWYYATAAGGLGLLAALTAARIRRPERAVPALAAVAVLAVAGAVSVAVTGPRPLTSNWATADQYRQIAAQLPRGATIESPGEVGTLAYYCRCRVLDGLADRGSISAGLQARIDGAHGVGGWLLRLDYRNFRPVPPVPRDLRMTTRVVPEPSSTMLTRWGPPRTWSLVAP